MEDFLSGFVALAGKPNVGKSTLMNLLVGEKISIISNKPQTTRNRILSVLTGDDFQIVFIDTPGIHAPKHKLGEFMVAGAMSALSEVDVALYLVEPTKSVSADEFECLKGVKVPVFLVINKIDKIDKTSLLGLISKYEKLYDFAEIIPISALKAENTDQLLSSLKSHLPKGPKYFPDDTLTDQPEKQIAAELIREKALMYLQDEIPHGIAVEIMAMTKRKDKDLVDIEATIYCEKTSHKGIIIGKNGETLKMIGTGARVDIERLLGSKIYIELWVKVKKDWRDNDFLLKSFGYK